MSSLSGPVSSGSSLRPIVAALLAVSLTASSLTLAQTPAPSRADVLFREGREATKKQDHALACQKYAESYALDAAPGTLVNLGSCEEKIGKVSQAWHHLNDAILQLPSTDDRVPVARALLEGLGAKIARVTVSITGADAGDVKVLVDGSEVPSSERGTGVVLDPGEHVVLGRTRDGREARQVVQPKAGQKLDVPLTFARVEAPPVATTSTTTSALPPPPPPPPPSGRGRRIATYVDLGLGVVGLGLGTFFGLSASSKNSDAKKICVDREGACPAADVARHDDLVSDAKTARTLSFVGLGVGGALVITGVVLLVTSPKQAPSTGVRILPEVGPRSAGLSLGGAW